MEIITSTGVLTALSGAATLASAVGSLVSGSQQAAAAERNAQFQEAEAARAKDAAAAEESRVRDRARRVLSAQKAAYGASGVTSEEGSPLLAAADSAEEAELDALAARYTGAVRSTSALAQAESYRATGSAARMGGLVGAGTSLLAGAVRIGQINRPSSVGQPKLVE